MSHHSPGALRAAVAIVNARSSIPTAAGDKSAGELADFIEAETRIVELIDASQRLLQSVETASAADLEDHDSAPCVSAERIEQLRSALLAVLESDTGPAQARDSRH